MITKNKHRVIYNSILIIALMIVFMSLAACWKPFMQYNDSTGYVKYRWSGFSAWFTGQRFGVQRDYYLKRQFNGQDGPYLFYEQEKYIGYEVSGSNRLITKFINPGDSFMVRIPNADQDSFSVIIRKHNAIQSAEWPEPSKMVVISDIEGNFSGLYGFLLRNKVIDKNYNWIFGNGHVVFLGDFVDRGPHTIQVLWLIYSLEEKAIRSNGRVHYILGNHEVMNIQGIAKDADPKSVKLSQEITGKENWKDAYKVLYSSKSVMGEWLRSKNAIEKIGKTLFVHGGISPKILAFRPDITTINDLIRQSLDSNLYDHYDRMDLSALIAGREGVLWYRGLVQSYKYYEKATPIDFDKILQHFQVTKIVIGHTLNKDIATDFNGGLIKIDVLHGQSKYTGATKGLFYENGFFWEVNDLGDTSSLN
ncbi:MAG: metallophosphoesterase [Bacteroidota bacterium]